MVRFLLINFASVSTLKFFSFKFSFCVLLCFGELIIIAEEVPSEDSRGVVKSLDMVSMFFGLFIPLVNFIYQLCRLLDFVVCLNICLFLLGDGVFLFSMTGETEFVLVSGSLPIY